MLTFLQITTLLLVALAMVPAVAHALELPGKLRLPKETYLAVQPIYYPGFTIVGGVGEVGGLLATFGLLLATPPAAPSFHYTLLALVALASMQGVFWVFTQPVNKVWLRDQPLQGVSAAFFGLGDKKPNEPTKDDWTTLRDQWEYSHVVRAVLSFTALGLLAGAIATRDPGLEPVEVDPEVASDLETFAGR